MIGPMEKAMKAVPVQAPPEGVYEGVDLRTLPKYICFRAALLRSKLTQQYVILILAAFIVVSFIASRVEVYSLYGKLREKEYILAPGVQDFTPAQARSVPDTYVSDAVVDFLAQLGNVNSANIDQQYSGLAEMMSPQLRVRFLAEASEFKAKVKDENISEILSITQTEIQPSEVGVYHVTALARRDSYINHEYVGNLEEVIEMELQLVPPKGGKRWYLQINSLVRQSANTFRAKQKY